MQQRARQERLNSSRKWKAVDHSKLLPMKDDGNFKPGSLDVAVETFVEGTSESIGSDDDDKEILPGEGESENLPNSCEDNDITLKKEFNVENCSCISLDSTPLKKGDKYDSCEHDGCLISIKKGVCETDEGPSSEVLISNLKSKRHSDRDLDNPKPCKTRRPIDDSASLARKYSNVSFCSVEDFLPDGFFDAGRDRPFMLLKNYEQSVHLDAREVILMDRLFYLCTFC